jgi:hypothetical protein
VTHPEHFSQVDGVIAPQPWMQMRAVARSSTPSISRSFGVSGGGSKNELLQSITTSWTNNTPLAQWVYGIVHQGGSAVSLQSRSRAYLSVSHAMKVELTPKAIVAADLVEVSRFGGGADIGTGGLLGIGTAYGIHEVRVHSTSVPLMPQLTGWKLVQPSQTVSAQVDCRFISDFWENNSVDGGNANSASTALAGELAVDLFAIPQIAPPPPRLIPTVVATATAMEIGKPVKVTRPTSVQAGDILVAMVGNQWGATDVMTAPDDNWKLLHSVNDGFWGLNGTHFRVWLRLATASEPTTYTFGNAPLAEEIVHLIVLRNASMPGGDIDTSGWSVASTRAIWGPSADKHVCPPITSNGQMLLCSTFFALTDNPLDLVLGPSPVTVSIPAGMTKAGEKYGKSSTLSVAYLNKPPNPTGSRKFVSTPRAYYSDNSINVSILVPGKQQF